MERFRIVSAGVWSNLDLGNKQYYIELDNGTKLVLSKDEFREFQFEVGSGTLEGLKGVSVKLIPKPVFG